MDELTPESLTEAEALKATRTSVDAWRGRQIKPDEAPSEIGDILQATQRWVLEANIIRFQTLLLGCTSEDTRAALEGLLLSAQRGLADLQAASPDAPTPALAPVRR
jgi:hypothetical protein